MNNEKDALGATIKNARIALGMTQEQLAERLDISGRYIMQIENDHKKPSFGLLVRIIRELSIQPEQIFYPEKTSNNSQVEELSRMLYNCDERSMTVICATVKATLESQQRE